MKILALIQPKTVARTRANVGSTGKVAIPFPRQSLEGSLRGWIGILLENQIHCPRLSVPRRENGSGLEL
jgi:hypothetical protein